MFPLESCCWLSFLKVGLPCRRKLQKLFSSDRFACIDDCVTMSCSLRIRPPRVKRVEIFDKYHSTAAETASGFVCSAVQFRKPTMDVACRCRHYVCGGVCGSKCGKCGRQAGVVWPTLCGELSGPKQRTRFKDTRSSTSG